MLYYEGIVQDISDRKRREAELKRQLQELQEFKVERYCDRSFDKAIAKILHFTAFNRESIVSNTFRIVIR